MKILVTGGAGFIGSAVCRQLIAAGDQVLNVDNLTYAGTITSLRQIDNHHNYRFMKVDICDGETMLEILKAYEIEAVMNLAAESHVDRSIDGPETFIQTNIVGTFRLLHAVRAYWDGLKGSRKKQFRFHHVSTDEVFGDLPLDSGIFTETSPYAPSSPYSASKAASDHLVRAWHETYGLPVVLSNCSNNYGHFHFPEKLIPLVTLNAMDERTLPVYGKGENVRDWLYVDDHARALELVLKKGRSGETYMIGGRSERSNLQVVETICHLLDAKRPRANGKKYASLIEFVADRPGHDRRYAVDPSKIERELGWSQTVTFETGMDKTVSWYLDNEWWWRPLRNKIYKGTRLGLTKQSAPSDTIDEGIPDVALAGFGEDGPSSKINPEPWGNT